MPWCVILSLFDRDTGRNEIVCHSPGQLQAARNHLRTRLNVERAKKGLPPLPILGKKKPVKEPITNGSG